MPALARRISPELVVGAGCLIALITFGPRAAAGLFQLPMVTEYGWGREVFSLAIAIQNLLWGVGAPFAGAVADRFGMVRVLCAGALTYALGLVVMSQATSPGMMHLGAGVLIGFGLAGCSFNLALSVLAVLPLSLALATRALNAQKAGSSPVADQSIAQALSEAFRHRSYVLLVLGFFTCGFQLAFITAHLPAFLKDAGLPASVGGWTLAVIGLANAVGSLSAGWLSTRMANCWLLAWIYLGRSVAIAAFILVPDLAGELPRLRLRHGPLVALDRAADLIPRDADVRHPIHRDAVRFRLLLAPGRRLPRRRAVRGLWHLRPRVVALCCARHRLCRSRSARSSAPSPCRPSSRGSGPGRRERLRGRAHGRGRAVADLEHRERAVVQAVGLEPEHSVG